MKITSFARITAFLVLLSLSVTGCQKGGGTAALEGNGEELDDSMNPFDSGFYGDLGASLGGNISGGGSGTGGGLTDADKAALQNLSKAMEEVNPESGGEIPPELLGQVNDLIKKEKNGEDVSVLKMTLAGKILTDCMAKLAPLAPVPGQPLVGTWSGGGACPVGFEVRGPVANNTYAVLKAEAPTKSNMKKTEDQKAFLNERGIASVGRKAAEDDKETTVDPIKTTEGQMAVAADGSGAVKGKPFSGPLTDQPMAGTGSMTHPTHTKTKYGTDPCTVKVELAVSRNPIPENSLEAMRLAGSCHRKALMLMSPIFDNLFKSMPKDLAAILQQRALGINAQ